MLRKFLFSALALASLATAAPASAGNYGSGYAAHDNQGGYRQHYSQGGYDRECFDKPVRKWRHGRLVIVGYRTVCH